MKALHSVDESVLDHRAVPSGPIVVATDGLPQSEGALAVSRCLAAATGSDVKVVSVQPPLAIDLPDPSMLLGPSAVTRLAAVLKERVRSQCAAVSATGPGPVLCEPELFTGAPEREIAGSAATHHAALIVLGLGRHAVLDRIFGSETAVKVARISPVPVLAVPAAMRSAPRRMVIGLDFSDASIRAANAAVRLLTEGGVVHLVHVAPRDRLLVDPWISDREYDATIRHRFARLRARLALPPGVTIDQATRSGDIARELIDYAAEQGADVIAAGSHGHGFVSRVVLGSVTSALLRAAQTAVLVVPPDGS